MNPGAYECDGLTLKQCRTNQTGYDVIKACPLDTECDPVAGDCGQLCTPGRFQCNGATLRKCGSDGHWVDSAKCETTALCNVSSDGATGSCVTSPCGTADFSCSGAKLKKCRDDRTDYDDYKTCASAPLCDAPSGRCIEPTCLQPNAYQCFGQDLKQCSGDQTTWIPIKTCAASQYCDASATNPGLFYRVPGQSAALQRKGDGTLHEEQRLEHAGHLRHARLVLMCAPRSGWRRPAHQLVRARAVHRRLR